MAQADLSRINSNIGALNALNSLRTIQNDMALRQLRLATGNRITQAADDPAGFRIAVKLNARSRGLSQAVDNIGDAKNMLSTAETGLTKVKDLLLTIRDKLVTGANDTLGSEERLAIAQQVREYMHEITRTAHETRWNDIGLLDDSAPAASTSAASTTFYFQTGSDANETTVWARGFKILTNGTSEDDWNVNWTTQAGSLSVTFADARNTASVKSYSVYDSASGLAPTDAKFTVKDVYQSLGVGVLGGIGSASDTSNVNASVNALLKNVDAAIRGVSDWVASIGALSARLDSKSQSVAAMQVNVEASYNRIFNADMAYEQLQLTKSQILQQTAVSMLAQANTAPQQILTLFR
ncbi:flagellin [Coprothermobacter platensis]|uniref:flagellin n=1 Tax=Coprothermobacter platensis TaxID=108819 RepID=UPI000366CDD0|nr:flagellin [Coprothermobacter platensis]